MKILFFVSIYSNFGVVVVTKFTPRPRLFEVVIRRRAFYTFFKEFGFVILIVVEYSVELCWVRSCKGVLCTRNKAKFNML